MSNQEQIPQKEGNRAKEPSAPQPKRKRKPAKKIITRGALIGLGLLTAVLAALLLWAYLTMIRMPGKSHTGPLPPLTAEQIVLRHELVRDVDMLATQIGDRNVWNYSNLTAAADFIEAALANAGCLTRRQNFQAADTACCNIEVEIKGSTRPDEIVIVGAHYDTVPGSPGANDNGSGVAAALALARRFVKRQPARTLRFLFFANEEPPFFQTDQMGSLVYAKSCKQKTDNVVAMLCLETIAYYTDQPNSQQYPWPFSLLYPSTGNFLAFVSDLSSRKLLHTAIACFRANCKFPSQGGAIPKFVTAITWSDQWSFWQNGYPAIMLTDTAPFRYPYYHGPHDKPDRLSHDHFARVTSGLQAVVAQLSQTDHK